MIVIGAGVIGLAVALELRKRGLSVLVVEKGQAAREASWAAGGMLADCPLEMPTALHSLAAASARMYPDFVRELETESGIAVDLRSEGTLFFSSEEGGDLSAKYQLPRPLRQLEPDFCVPSSWPVCLFLKERSVDPRGLTEALFAMAKKRGVEFLLNAPVREIELKDGASVHANDDRFSAGGVVNCAGAWAGEISPVPLPTRPVKGQMLSLAMPRKEFLRHVVRTADVYLIPRSDGRLVVGATSEDAGFDKTLVPTTIEKQRQAAVRLVPELASARVVETWSGLRPGTPDKLPILGATSSPGYFVATGHYRDGILLAPVTARIIGDVVCGQKPQIDLVAFSAERFVKTAVEYGHTA